MEHLTPPPACWGKGGFTRWQDTAVFTIEAKKNGKMPPDVTDYQYEELRAWYLKV